MTQFFINKPKFHDIVRLEHFNLGDELIVYWHWRKNIHVKFIKVTKCGYNLLDIDTNKCILKQHLYPAKLDGKVMDCSYWLTRNLNIKKRLK